MIKRRSTISKKRLDTHTCELPKTSDSNLQKLPPNARFYSHWKRNFQKFILVSVNHPFTHIFLRSRAAIAFEKRRHGRSSIWWVIHPCSDFRFCWDTLMTFVLFYIFLSVPYIISFHRVARNTEPEYWDSVYPAYIICIVDIFLNFVTGFASHGGHEIFLDPILIARHYLKGYFLIDLISSVPYIWFHRSHILPPGPNSNSILLIPEFLPIIKILRIPTLRFYIRQINTIFVISHAREMIVWLVYLTLLIFHWSSCVTHIFPFIVMHVKGESMEGSEVYKIKTELYNEPSWKIYLIYLHMGVSHLVGSSFVEFESLDSKDIAIRCTLLLLGKGYMIYLMVIILQLVESSAEPELKYQRIMHQVKEFAHEKKLPKRLKDKLIAYYEYRFQGSYFKENAISATLSNHLNQEIIIHSSRGLLETATILHNLPRNVIGTLMAVLKPVIYLEEDIIYRCNSEGDSMYFIASGTVALVTFYGKEVCHVKDGGYFGEGALIYSDRRRFESVIALEACELLYLNRRDFKRLFTLTSEFYIRIEKFAKERLDKINELNNAHQKAQEEEKESLITTVSASAGDNKKTDDNIASSNEFEKLHNEDNNEKGKK